MYNVIKTNIIPGFLGIVLLSFSIVIRIKTGLGLDSLNALYGNLSMVTGLTVGFFSVLIGFIFIILNMIVCKKRFNIVAMVVAFLIGINIDIFNKLFANILNFDSLFKNIILFTLMIIIGGIAIGLLIFSAMPSPLEEYQFSIQKLFNISIAASKFYSDLSLLIIAAIVSFLSNNGLGQINIGTIVTIAVTGKIVDVSLRILNRRRARTNDKILYS